MPHVTNDTVRIHYDVTGAGPPLILQHGFFWSSEGWRRVGYVDALKDRFKLILIDARGHGLSDKPHDGAAYALETLVSDITSVMDDVGNAITPSDTSHRKTTLGKLSADYGWGRLKSRTNGGRRRGVRERGRFGKRRS